MSRQSIDSMAINQRGKERVGNTDSMVCLCLCLAILVLLLVCVCFLFQFNTDFRFKSLTVLWIKTKAKFEPTKAKLKITTVFLYSSDFGCISFCVKHMLDYCRILGSFYFHKYLFFCCWCMLIWPLLQRRYTIWQWKPFNQIINNFSMVSFSWGLNFVRRFTSPFSLPLFRHFPNSISLTLICIYTRHSLTHSLAV